MNTLFLTVTKTGGAVKRPKICLMGKWLPEMGFVTDSLVMAIPEENGITFTLCNENIKKYSDLVKHTKEKNGKLISILWMAHKGSHYPTLHTTGNYICSSGLEIGDSVAVRYEYGVIQLKKIDQAHRNDSNNTDAPTVRGRRKLVQNQLGLTEDSSIKIAVVGKSRRNHAYLYVPTIRLTGEWMKEIGFVKDGLMTISSEPDSILFQLQNEDIRQYSALVKYAREHHMQLAQVGEINSRKKKVPHICLTGSPLECAGFHFEDVFTISYKQGFIRLTKVNLKQFGF